MYSMYQLYRKKNTIAIIGKGHPYVYIYIYMYTYISIIYRCTPKWQTSIGHSFQNAMDHHGFFLGGMWRTKHAMLSKQPRLGNHGSLRWPNGGRFLGYGMVGG